jgi:hypothetical protein
VNAPIKEHAPALAIREVTDGDIDALVALWDAAGLTRPWNPPLRDIALARRGEHSTILTGWLGEALVGSAMVGEDGHRGWVYYVGADPSHRGQGVGRAMMKAAEAWLTARGVWKMQLMVRADNTAVHDFYQSIGFEKTDVVVFQKWIGEP